MDYSKFLEMIEKAKIDPNYHWERLFFSYENLPKTQQAIDEYKKKINPVQVNITLGNNYVRSPMMTHGDKVTIKHWQKLPGQHRIKRKKAVARLRQKEFTPKFIVTANTGNLHYTLKPFNF